MNKKIKELLFNHCKNQIESRLSKYNSRDKELYESLNSETKSSAGDKHETGRAMIQLEREKLGEQIKKAEQNQVFLNQLKHYKSTGVVRFGSVVQTNNSDYYIAIPVNNCLIDTSTFHCISPQSPIGVLLLGKKVGDVSLPRRIGGQFRCFLGGLFGDAAALGVIVRFFGFRKIVAEKGHLRYVVDHLREVLDRHRFALLRPRDSRGLFFWGGGSSLDQEGTGSSGEKTGRNVGRGRSAVILE
jgi:transcription elongation GreA/GreB family factor